MTPKQTRIYWAAWGAVRKADPTADRHELHRRAFNGQDKSSKDFNTTTDLDAVLAVFRSISDPANLYAQLRPARQVEARVTHARYNHIALLTALFQTDHSNEHETLHTTPQTDLGESPSGAAISPSAARQSGSVHRTSEALEGRAEKYLAAILRQRFKVASVSDLSQSPTYRANQHRGPSQLMMYIYTVSRAIDRLRAKKQWSQHDLYTAAHLKCPCLACRRRSSDGPSVPVPALADSNHPF